MLINANCTQTKRIWMKKQQCRMLGRFVPTHDDLFFPFPYMPPLPLCIYKLFSEYFLEHAAIISSIKTSKTKSFFIHVFIWQKQDPSTWWNSVQVQFPMINLRQKHSTWNPNWTHTLALPFPRPILSLQISRSDRTRNIFQHIKSVISRKISLR